MEYVAKTALFEVWKDDKRVFWTEHEECIPDEDVIKNMKKHGYKIKRRSAKRK